MLASGSRGNAIYVSDGRTAVLIDAGLSGVEIERRLKLRGISAGDLQAIVVSHEHSDHIQGVGVLSRRYRLPVYISCKTAKAAATIGRVHRQVHFECGTAFSVNGLRIHPFSISHDAQDPAGFAIQAGGLRIGVATDLGIATAVVREHLKGSHTLILEANHDPAMLIEGPYPWPLKQRIQSRRGHLSNDDSRCLLGELVHARLRNVILAHLSETNNTPERALQAIAPALNNSSTRLLTAGQDCGTELIQLI
jgi:phosphoribosyl 1,2-cyclic phosphodiesterase